MAELLLINPKRRRRSTAKRRAPVRAAKRRVTRRRKNPFPVSLARHSPVRRRRTSAARRRNPIRARRRRNPIGGLRGLSTNGIMTMLKAAFIGGAGSLAIDYLQGSVINPMLPVSMQANPMSVGAGDAVKALITVLAGHFLDKPTKGLSKQMAVGALTVQARDVLAKTILPASATLAGLGWATPARVMRGSARVGPGIRQGIANVGAFQRPGGASPLLNAFMNPGARTPLLSRGNNVAQRESVRYT